jgi:hypothetical protein
MRLDSTLLIAVDRKRGDKLSRFFGWFVLQMWHRFSGQSFDPLRQFAGDVTHLEDGRLG